MTSSRSISRRAFLTRSGQVAAALLTVTDGLSLLTRDAGAAAWMLPSTTPETPNAHEQATMKAIGDTSSQLGRRAGRDGHRRVHLAE